MSPVLLSPDMAKRLDAQEADPYHIPEARQALEAALAAQFRELARGLFADFLMRGEVPDEDVWWYQYASLHEPLERPPADKFTANLETLGVMGFQDPTTPWEHAQVLFQTVRQSLTALYLKRAVETDRNLAAFQAFRKSFPADAALRRVRWISPAEALETPVRIYGGEVELWQEGRINRQLSDLGSDMRYAIEGARRERIRKARALVGQPAEAPPQVPRFVLGEAAPTSAVGRITFLEIEREFAVSPYVGASPGYAEGSRAVVRRSVPWRLPGIDPGGHEMYHALTTPDQSSGPASWRAALRADLCRFCRTPRPFGKIAYEFSRVFGIDMELARALSYGPLSTAPIPGTGYPAGESPAELPLYGILDELCQDELLIRREGTYYCPLFEEGRRWHLA